MADTTFQNGYTVIDAGWCNDLNTIAYKQSLPSAGFPYLNLHTKSLKRNFGAAGGGLVDDYSAIASAITTSGRTIEIDADTFLFGQALPTPTCAQIIGSCPSSSILKAGGSVSGVALTLTGGIKIRDFLLEGVLTNGVGGIAYGIGSTWYGESHNVRVQHFTGAGAYGMRLADDLKSLIVHPYLDGNYDNFRCDRNSPTFPTSTRVLQMISVNAANLGLDVVDADAIVFDGATFDSNAKGAIRLLPRSAGNITGLEFLEPRFEDNAATQSTGVTDGANRYQVYAGDGTSIGGATIRFVMRDPVFQPGNSGARSFLVNGSCVAGFRLVGPDCPNSSQISLIGGAYGRIDEWSPHISYTTCVYDPLGNDYGPWGARNLVRLPQGAPTIASATTIAPSSFVSFVSGTALIKNITALSAFGAGGGQITLIPTGAWTTDATGNIAAATTAVVGKSLIMTYDAATAKWYPSY